MARTDADQSNTKAHFIIAKNRLDDPQHFRENFLQPNGTKVELVLLHPS